MRVFHKINVKPGCLRNKLKITLGLLLFFYITLHEPQAYGVIVEKVVGYVSDEAITLTDLCSYWQSLREIQPDININDALEALINRKVIIQKSKDLNLSAPSEEELIDLYIRIAIKPRVMVTKEEVKRYYRRYYSKLKGAPLKSIEPHIIKILTEKKTNDLLKKHLEELKKTMPVGINGPIDETLCGEQK